MLILNSLQPYEHTSVKNIHQNNSFQKDAAVKTQSNTILSKCTTYGIVPDAIQGGQVKSSEFIYFQNCNSTYIHTYISYTILSLKEGRPEKYNLSSWPPGYLINMILIDRKNNNNNKYNQRTMTCMTKLVKINHK